MDTLVKRSDSIELRKSGEDVVVYDPKADKVHILNASAGEILETCGEPKSIKEIASALQSRYGISEAQAFEDANEAVALFRDLGLIVAI